MSSTEMDDKATAPESVKRPDFLEKSEYYRKILDMQEEYPHLRSLSLYMEMTEKLRIEGKLGSHSSDSILLADIADKELAICHRVDVYEKDPLKDVNSYEENFQNMLKEPGWQRTTLYYSRIIVLEDLSPAAIDVLGTRFHIDPHVFYYHLGLDSQDSTVSKFAAMGAEPGLIPTSTCIEGRAPPDFISVPIPYDMKPTANIPAVAGINRSYCQIKEYLALAKPLEQNDSNNACGAIRSFPRLSVLYPQKATRIYVIILAFPTWHEFQSKTDKASKFEIPIPDFGLRFNSWQPQTPIPKRAWHKHKKGLWDHAQWERIEPMYRSLLHWISPASTRVDESPFPLASNHIYQNALLWLYSMTDDAYNLSLQIESQCWQQLQVAFDFHRGLEPLHQYSKRQLRESILKTVDFLETSRHWLGGVNNDYLFVPKQFRARIELTLKSKKALAAEIQRSIDDYQGEAEMKLIRAKLKRMMTPPSSPIARPDNSKRNDSILEMLDNIDSSPKRKSPVDKV